MRMTIQIKSITFQRNGVHGNGFYHCFFSNSKSHKNMLATFETETIESENVEIVDKVNCRVVNLDAPELTYRGDEFGQWFNDYFKAKGVNYIYDLTTNAKEAKV